MKIVSVTPAGRKIQLAILIPYLLKNRGKIDEHHFWVNSIFDSDIAYIRKACDEHPDFFKFIECPLGSPIPKPMWPYQSLNSFHALCKDEDTIYIRFDDDICWIDEDFVENMVKFRTENPEYFLVSANVINNGVCAMLHQRCGAIKHPMVCDGICGGNAWADPEFALFQHRELIRHIKDKTTDVYKCFKQWVLLDVLKNYDRSINPEMKFKEPGRFSINCVCWFGRDYPRYCESFYKDGVFKGEETWPTYYYPREVNKFNVICGDAVVAHFSYGVQRQTLIMSDVIQQYTELANAL